MLYPSSYSEASTKTEAKFAEAAEVSKTDLVPSILPLLKKKKDLKKGVYTAGTYWYRSPFRPIYEYQINN